MLNHKLRREKNMYLNGWVTYEFDEIAGEHVRDASGRLVQVRHEGIKELEEKLEIADDNERVDIDNRIEELRGYMSEKSAKAKEVKDRLLSLLSNKVEENIRTNGRHHIRELREEQLSDKNVISVFDSYFTRTIGAKPDEFCEDFMVIQVYYFDVIKDLIYHGFTFKGERYVYFTSSAGQIRTKKCVFVKESVWKKHEKSLMCGLTIDDINAKGGNNPNKHLAYLALANSATDVWEDFDIDKTIVIDDFETEVYGEYDLIDEADYSITRTQGHIPIAHTDGAGMMLPSLGKNRMVRLPWVKGLLGAFDFRKFIEVNGCSPVIKDIYGKSHDVIAEDIQIIFTKSQFKMWKYYDSWDHYKEMYKRYGCTAGMTNVEEDRIKNATINYQMLQTLTDVTDDEILEIAGRSIGRLNGMCSSIENIKEVFGAVNYNLNKTSFQKCVSIYPDLLNDDYAKAHLKSVKDSMVRDYKSGKLEVKGKYTFILPDLYAACEHWFMGIDNPNGLLDDQEVFCWLFRKYHKDRKDRETGVLVVGEKHDKIDCLRSPHLFMEHAIRDNIACNKYSIDGDDRSRYGKSQQDLREWFCTDAIYTSCKDMISRILQFDVDGDKALVVTDRKLIEVAQRNIDKFDIVPLYYNMRKAESAPLNNENIYNGLNAAFVGGNIGIYSNNISKIWNSDVFVSGTEDERRDAIDLIKLLCCENNFVIDYAKTLYKPTRPKHIDKKITEFTKGLLPHFFKYAKDKDDGQVEKRNSSFVNKLDSEINDKEVIPNPRIMTKRLGLGKIDYKLMMSNPDIEFRVAFTDKGKIIKEETDPLIVKYCEFNKEYYVSLDNTISTNKAYKNDSHMRAKAKYDKMFNDIDSALSQFGYSRIEITDILVKFLYGMRNAKNKAAMWLYCGDVIYENLIGNIGSQKREVQCIDCGEWFEVGKDNKRTVRCCGCQEEADYTPMETKVIICVDCEKSFEMPSSPRRIRCNDCHDLYQKERNKRKNQTYRNKTYNS